MTGESATVDREALLCALVLAPTTFARNRFFALYTEPWARKTRSRAAQLRTVVRHLCALSPKPELRELVSLENGGTIVRYALPDLHFERTATLEPLELAVVRFALARRAVAGVEGDAPMRLTEEDRKRVERALAKLSQKIGLPATAELQRSTHSTPPTTGES